LLASSIGFRADFHFVFPLTQSFIEMLKKQGAVAGRYYRGAFQSPDD
jgi:hypothetical protein